MEATVYKSTGSWYVVKTGENFTYNSRIKGKFKISDITSTNPVAVGDHVDVEMENENESSVVITKIYDRKNYITRQSPHNKNQHHIIASNLDQSLLFATLKDPKTSSGFIDRFLVASEAYHVPSIIVFNKSDLYKQKELARFDELKELFHEEAEKMGKVKEVELIGNYKEVFIKKTEKKLRKEEDKKIATIMKAKNEPIEKIIEYTGLTKKEIKEL